MVCLQRAAWKSKLWEIKRLEFVLGDIYLSQVCDTVSHIRDTVTMTQRATFNEGTAMAIISIESDRRSVRPPTTMQDILCLKIQVVVSRGTATHLGINFHQSSQPRDNSSSCNYTEIRQRLLHLENIFTSSSSHT